jgi:hypothetical protein
MKIRIFFVLFSTLFVISGALPMILTPGALAQVNDLIAATQAFIITTEGSMAQSGQYTQSAGNFIKLVQGTPTPTPPTPSPTPCQPTPGTPGGTIYLGNYQLSNGENGSFSLTVPNGGTATGAGAPTEFPKDPVVVEQGNATVTAQLNTSSGSGTGTIAFTSSGTGITGNITFFAKFPYDPTPPQTCGTPTPTPTPTPTASPTPSPTVSPTPGGNGSISGMVTYYGGQQQPVPGVTVTAVGQTFAMSTTNASGAYTLTGLTNGTYSVIPQYNGPVNGISSQDAARIAQYAAGLTTLTPNQLIAADTSGNGSVTSQDAARLAQYVAGLPSNSFTGTWQFAPANRVYPSFTNSLTGENYAAILIGDVTGNWAVSSRPADETADVPPARAPALDGSSTAGLRKRGLGRIITLPVRVDKMTGKDVTSFDFAVSFDPTVLEPVMVGNTGTLAGGFVVTNNASSPGRLIVSGYGIEPLAGSGTLLNLSFRVIGGPSSTPEVRWESFIFNEEESVAGAFDSLATPLEYNPRGRLLTPITDLGSILGGRGLTR